MILPVYHHSGVMNDFCKNGLIYAKTSIENPFLYVIICVSKNPGVLIMKIVIFDDDPSDLKKIETIIRQWALKADCADLIIYPFQDISSLEFSYPDILNTDIFFLDIMTSDNSSAGFLLAEKIHIKNPLANIVFTTNTPDFWSNAFDISALHYLIKPLQSNKVELLLNEIYRSPSRRKTASVVLPGFGEEYVLDLDQILYLEGNTSRHVALIYLTGGSVLEINLASIPFSSLPGNVLPDDFAQCHRSYIPNLNYITRYDNYSLSLKDCRRKLPIGKQYRSSFLSKLINKRKAW